MKLPIVASLILLVAMLALRIRYLNKSSSQTLADYMKREEEANYVRKQSLDGLPYLQVDLTKLPMTTLKDDPEIAGIQEKLKDLAGKPILNLAGRSNTDLKLEYGTANISVLSEYDENYMQLITLLQSWAEYLNTRGKDLDAGQILEYAIEIGSDVVPTYQMLAGLYVSHGRMDLVEDLKKTAAALPSSSKDRILRELDKVTSLDDLLS